MTWLPPGPDGIPICVGPIGPKVEMGPADWVIRDPQDAYTKGVRVARAIGQEPRDEPHTWTFLALCFLQGLALGFAIGLLTHAGWL
jgi:hypothetical protein